MTRHGLGSIQGGRSCGDQKSSWTLRVARSVAEVEALRSIWMKLQWHPNADIDHYLTVVNVRKEVIRPHVITLYRDGSPKALMIGRLENIRLDISIGYKTLLRPQMRTLTIVYGGVLGEQGELSSSLLMRELLKTLGRGEAEVVRLPFLPIGCPLLSKAVSMPSPLCRDYVHIPNIHWRIVLPPSYDQYLASLSAGSRRNLRKYASRLTRAFGEKLYVRRVSNLEALEEAMRDMEIIARRTYQRGLGVGFRDDEETLRRYRLGLERGWLTCFILYIDAKPVAFLSELHYADTVYPDSIGFDPNYREHNVGTHLLGILIRSAIERDAGYIDFGFGDAEYKAIFANDKWEEASVFVFAMATRSVLINMTRTSIGFVGQLMRTFLRWVRLEARVKRNWRRHVSR